MDVLTPLVTGVLLAFFTAVQLWVNRGQFDDFKRRMDLHEQSNERRFEQITSEIAALRSDLTQIALALGGRTQTG